MGSQAAELSVRFERANDELIAIARLGGLPETAMMLYALRDRAEHEVVYGLVLASYRFAGGRDAAPPASA